MIAAMLATISIWVRLSGPQGGNCQSIDVNPANHQTLLCCTWDGSSGGVYRSTDGGREWTLTIGIPLELGYGTSVVRFCPTDTALVLCGTRMMGTNGLFRSEDGGRSWARTNYGEGYTNDIVFAPGSRETVLVVSGLGVARSTDHGSTWHRLLRTNNLWRVGFKPGSPSTIVAGGYSGMYCSRNCGISWDTCLFDRPVYDFVFDPVAPDTMYVAAHTRGVFKVWNLGAAWDSLGNGDRYNTTIALDSARRELFTGGFAYGPVPGGICHSTDMGRTWREFGASQLYDLVCNDLCVPPNDTVIYAAGGYFGPLRLPRRDSVWRHAFAGMCEANIRAIAATNNDVAYTSGSVMGISRADKYGLLWQTLVNTPVCGLPHETEMLPPGLAVSRTNSDSVYATFWGYNPPCQLVFSSGNGGITWQEHRVPDLRSTDQLNTLCVHPFGSETLYLASQRGLYKSTDAGATWRRLDTVLCYHVAVDQHDPVTVYASGMLTLRRSTDAGETWHDFSLGLSQNSEPMMVEPDPESAGVLYAALCGGEMMDPQSGVYVYRRSVGFWQRKSNGLPGPFVIRPRVAVDTRNRCIWAIVPVQGQRVYRSFDRGESWHAADSGLAARGVYVIACGSRTWLGTRGDGVWQWSEGTGIEESLRTVATDGRTKFAPGEEGLPAGTRLFDCCGRKVAGLPRLGVYFVSSKPGMTKVLLAR